MHRLQHQNTESDRNTQERFWTARRSSEGLPDYLRLAGNPPRMSVLTERTLCFHACSSDNTACKVSAWRRSEELCMFDVLGRADCDSPIRTLIPSLLPLSNCEGRPTCGG